MLLKNYSSLLVARHLIWKLRRNGLVTYALKSSGNRRAIGMSRCTAIGACFALMAAQILANQKMGLSSRRMRKFNGHMLHKVCYHVAHAINGSTAALLARAYRVWIRL
jgi:hypothetical protein